MSVFDDKLVKLKRGRDIAIQQCDVNPQNFYIIINRHLGDSFRYLRVLNSIRYYYGEQADEYHFHKKNLEIEIFKKKKRIKKLIVVTTQSIAGVARLYNEYLDEIIILPKADLDALELYAISGCSEHHNILCDANARWRVRGDWATDEGEYVRVEMFGVSDIMWDMCLPRGLSKYWGTMSIDEKTEIETTEMIRLGEINIDKMILLCPAAQSSSTMDLMLWEKFVQHLRKRILTFLQTFMGRNSRFMEQNQWICQ